MFDIEAFLSGHDRGELYKLIDGAIRFHANDGLILLNIASMETEGIVLHIM